MEKEKKHLRSNASFIISSILWTIAYISIYIVIFDPLHLTMIREHNEILLKGALVLALTAMTFSLIWGIKALRKTM